MTQPAYSSMPSPVLSHVPRLLAFLSILISLIILTTDSTTMPVNSSTEIKLRFKDVYAYRYALFALVLGFAYTLLQIVFGIYHVNMGKPISSSEGLLQFDFYADKVMSYILATGTGAAFGATIDLKEVFTGVSSNVDKFFNKGSAAASFLLFAFLFTAVSSVFSSLALPKKL